MRLILLFLFCFFNLLGAEPASCPCAGAAAASTDWLLTKGSVSPLLKPVSQVTARATSLALFPICSAADLVYHASQQNTQGMQRSLMGLMATPAGLLSPDLVTHHFIPATRKAHLVAPYGKLYQRKAFQFFPENVSEVQALVEEARATGKTIAVMGAGMSQGKQALPSDDWNFVINTSKLNRIVIDPLRKMALVGSGATWCDLQKAANAHGLAVQVMQASNIFSIGGSLSVNCHGWDHRLGSLRHTVLSLTLVDANGQILHLTPKDELFNYVVGGFGGFGIILEAELALTDNVAMSEEGEEVLPQDYLSYFEGKVLSNPAIEMHLYRLSIDPKNLFKTGIAVNYRRLESGGKVADLVEEPVGGQRSHRVKLHALRRLQWLGKLAWTQEKKLALEKKIATRNVFMRPPIKPILNNSNVDTEWLQEYFVKKEDLVDFLAFLGKILEQNQVPVFNASVRYVVQDSQSKLSYAQEGNRFAIVLFFNQKLNATAVEKTKRWVQQVIDYLAVRGGTYYLPYQHFATLDQFRACYPNWSQVQAHKLQNDPLGLFENGFYRDYILQQTQEKSLFRPVFNRTNGQRKEIRAFLANVFMQLDEEKFFALVDSVLEQPNLSDEEVYRAVYAKINRAKPNKVVGLQKTLKALATLKKDLADQATLLLGTERPLQGYVEIGYNGRLMRPLKKRLLLSGPLYVINDRESLSDYIEVSGTRPYDRFVPLNDYTPISEQEIPTESVDLVCLYIGLHHCPPEKLEGFISSIKRILRPGGTFILMDHDASTPELVMLVDVVHSIFNVATGVSTEENSREVRNFHSLQYWSEMLQAQGFTYYPRGPFVRVGDSTLNALVRFDKPLKAKATLQLDAKYVRAQTKTYLTGPEWQNVRAAQQYAQFVEHQPAYRYPYFAEVGNFWKVFGKSWGAAQRDHSFSEVAFSEYNLMNLFVGTTMTLEYGAKGILALPVDMLDRRTVEKQREGAELERLRSLKSYSQSIEHTPFYQYPYFSDIKSYWKEYAKDPGLKNTLAGAGMTVEYTLKGLIAMPLAWMYGSGDLKEAETIHLLIDDPHDLAAGVDGRLKVIEVQANVKHIEVPRYFVFKEIMHKLAHTKGIECLNIAGQDKIQIDLKMNRESQLVEGCHKLYDIPIATDQLHAYVACEVNVTHLLKVIRELERQGTEITLIHDF